jgi:hypothetical protein
LKLLILPFLEITGSLILLAFVPTNDFTTSSACALLGCLVVTFVHVPYAVRAKVVKIIGTFVVADLLIRIHQKGLKIRCCHRTLTSMSNPWNMTVSEVTICEEYTYGFRAFKATNTSEFTSHHNTTHPRQQPMIRRRTSGASVIKLLRKANISSQQSSEETNVNVMGLTTRWSQLMEISGEVESQPGKGEEEET